jgi:nitrogen fixation NifU-like protein
MAEKIYLETPDHHHDYDHDHDHDHDHDPHLLNEQFFSHANQPGHMGVLPSANGYAKGVGVCGDAIEVYLSVKNGKISEIRHSPKGCTYTVACGSAMCHLVSGKTLEAALTVMPEDVANELAGLPEDHMHCAALAVNTLGEAIDDYYQKVWGREKPQKASDPDAAPVSAAALRH